jgi:predicted histone-like DNA-binding protein
MTVPGEPKSTENKTYPVAQVRQVMDLPALAKHMASHGSVYSKGDILCVATQLTACIRELLLEGNKVDCGDLGSFCVSLISDGADNAEEFSTSQITDVKVRWQPSSEFKGLVNEATYEYVPSRKSQAEARKAEKELLNSKATYKPGENPDDDTEGGGLGD